jgi:hypothetical protein
MVNVAAHAWHHIRPARLIHLAQVGWWFSHAFKDVLVNSPVVGIGEHETRFSNSPTGERRPQFVAGFP